MLLPRVLLVAAAWWALAVPVFAADIPAPAPTDALSSTSTSVPTDAAGEPKEIEDDDPADITKMAAFSVTADRLETFGFRVGGQLSNPFGSAQPVVMAVQPNTAAAKAGLRPGDRVLTTDGASAAVTLFSLTKWRKLTQRKTAEIAAGKKVVTWVLEVESPDRKEKRTVRMSIPTAPPRWGATKWQPTGRPPATVEPGPLAARAKELLENGVWSNRRFGKELGLDASATAPLLGFEWSLAPQDRERHLIFVTQQRGRTEIVLEHSVAGRGGSAFLTSPTGALEKAAGYARKAGAGPFTRPEAIPSEQLREEFQREIGFWLHEVGRVTGRWPFEFIKTADVAANDDGTTGTPAANAARAIPMGQRAESFLKLTPAGDAQKKLFADALGRLGADDGQWAYTETVKGLDEKRVTVVRVDPSRPDAERCMLLKIDGKPPTDAEVKRWRFEGRDVSPALGDLPPIRNLVDTDDVRVAAEDVTSVVFELPLRGGNAQFPAEKFQALFRVNKTSRGFEDFRVKLRESFRVAGVVSVSEAGIEARFQTFDPAHPPQPVYLKAGGAVRVLLVKFARSFESSRTDFRRVPPAASE